MGITIILKNSENYQLSLFFKSESSELAHTVTVKVAGVSSGVFNAVLVEVNHYDK
jgi:hypothetical protein